MQPVHESTSGTPRITRCVVAPAAANWRMVPSVVSGERSVPSTIAQ